MALDAQGNWDVWMSQPFRDPPKKSDVDARGSRTVELRVYNREEVPLPAEIILQILAYLPWNGRDNQRALYACSLVSRTWYSATVPHLYERPYLSGSNFQQFVTTVCPSKNAHIRRSELAQLVKRLDMGALVHDGSKSLTARILGRLKGTLIEFVAPQASFSINSFAALSKCRSLVHLDLSLMSAAISVKTLFATLKALENLDTLFFPRTSTHDYERDLTPYAWPPKLRNLHLAGGIDDFFLRVHVKNVSLSLRKLSIQHCPMIYPGALRETLESIGPRLLHFTLRHPMNRLHRTALNETLGWCPNLIALRISVDYVDEDLFNGDIVSRDHPLRILDLECSPSAGQDVALDPEAVWAAIDKGLLTSLRSVRANARLAWTATAGLKESIQDLSDLMVALENENPTGVIPGVWIT